MADMDAVTAASHLDGSAEARSLNAYYITNAKRTGKQKLQMARSRRRLQQVISSQNTTLTSKFSNSSRTKTGYSK
jgi:hypothetical protein